MQELPASRDILLSEIGFIRPDWVEWQLQPLPSR